MHEIIHWAGMPAEGGGYGNHYTDAAMATAWNKLGVVMSVADYRSTYPDIVAECTKRDGYDYAESMASQVIASSIERSKNLDK